MNLFFMLFPNPRIIKPRTRAQSNPEHCKISYKIPILHRNLQNMKKSSNPKPHEKTNPEKSSNFQPRRMSNRETSNPEHELHSSCFSPNQDKPNWLTHLKSISAQKIHTHKLKPPPTTKTTITITHTTNHNNHKSPPKTHRRST